MACLWRGLTNEVGHSNSLYFRYVNGIHSASRSSIQVVSSPIIRSSMIIVVVALMVTDCWCYHPFHLPMTPSSRGLSFLEVAVDHHPFLLATFPYFPIGNSPLVGCICGGQFWWWWLMCSSGRIYLTLMMNKACFLTVPQINLGKKNLMIICLWLNGLKKTIM